MLNGYDICLDDEDDDEEKGDKGIKELLEGMSENRLFAKRFLKQRKIFLWGPVMDASALAAARRRVARGALGTSFETAASAGLAAVCSGAPVTDSVWGVEGGGSDGADLRTGGVLAMELGRPKGNCGRDAPSSVAHPSVRPGDAPRRQRASPGRTGEARGAAVPAACQFCCSGVCVARTAGALPTSVNCSVKPGNFDRRGTEVAQ